MYHKFSQPYPIQTFPPTDGIILSLCNVHNFRWIVTEATARITRCWIQWAKEVWIPLLSCFRRSGNTAGARATMDEPLEVGASGSGRDCTPGDHESPKKSRWGFIPERTLSRGRSKSRVYGVRKRRKKISLSFCVSQKVGLISSPNLKQQTELLLSPVLFL